jgi:hypothetical protein
MTEMRRQATLARDPDWNLDHGLGIYNTFLGHFNMLAEDGQFHDLFNHGYIHDEYSMTNRQRDAVAGLGWDSSMAWWVENSTFGHTGLAGAVYVDSTTDLGRLHQQMTDVRVRWTARLVMAADDEEFFSIYEQAMAEYSLLDHESVINEKNRLLAEAMAVLGDN